MERHCAAWGDKRGGEHGYYRQHFARDWNLALGPALDLPPEVPPFTLDHAHYALTSRTHGSYVLNDAR